MKKVLLLLFICIILSGCSIERIDGYDYKKILHNIISSEHDVHNTVGNGYKYYIPKGVIRTSTMNYNDVLKRNNNTYYLFVDVVSYYYKTKIEHQINDSIYYSSEFEKENKYGFIDIEEKNGKLYIQMVYNYAKIETYVQEDDLKQTIIDISYILSSVDFNDSLLKKMYEEGTLDSNEQTYKLFENKQKEGNFLEYVEQYDKYDESQTEQEIIIQETTTTKSTTTTSSN